MEFDGTFLISVISFIVFVFVMNAVFYNPILRIMKNREDVVENNFNSAVSIKSEILKQENYHSEQLNISRNQAQKTLDFEMQKLKSKKSKIIADYKHNLISNTEKEKDNLRKSALEAKETLKDNVVDIAKSISNILLGDNISQKLINKSQVHIKEEQV